MNLTHDASDNHEERPGPTQKEGRKKLYTPPRLVEWGSLTDLTRGLNNQPGDFPFKGGTRAT
jgi:hypothetical protein